MEKIRLKIVTDRKLCDNLEKRIEEVLSLYSKGEYLEGFTIDSVVLREKDLSAGEYSELSERIHDITERYDIRLCINSFFNAYGNGDMDIQLPFHIYKDIVEKGNTEFLKKNFRRTGVSVHSVDETVFARDNGADYVIYGHIFETGCKKNLKPRGLDNLGKVSEVEGIEVFAIGGINEQNAQKVIDAGADGICMMSGIMKKI